MFRFLFKLIRWLLVLFVLAVAWAYYEQTLLQTRAVTLTYPGLSASFDGLRIVFVTDIHQNEHFPPQRVDDLVAKVNALEPDMILLGGDYATTSATAVAFFERKPGFSAPMGVYGILGNHDRTVPEKNLPRLMSAMEDAGVHPVVNAIYPIKKDGQYLYLAGIDDYRNGHPDIAGVASALGGEDFVILLTHNPDAVTKIVKSKDGQGKTGWADLILAGHTHGGQINFFSWSPILPLFSRDAHKYRQGLYKPAPQTDLLVSAGVGTTFLPLRFMCLPEMHVITLKRSAQ